MKNLKFKKREGFTNTYVIDELGDELGHINTDSDLYHSNSRTQHKAYELYEIADQMTGGPTREDLFEAHNQLIEKAKQLRKRVSELMNELDKDASDLTVPGKKKDGI